MDEASRAGRLRRTIEALFAKREDPYAGADLGNAQRLGGLIGLLAGAIALLLLPFAPPTVALGSIGWPIAAVGIGLMLFGSFVLLRGTRQLSFDAMLVIGYLGVAQIALLEWLAGGRSTPYHQLYLLPALYVAGVHPPRRVLAFLGVLWLTASAPLVYKGGHAVIAADFASQMVLVSAVAMVTMVLMTVVRAQRLGLQKEGAEANQLARVDALTGLPNRRAFDEMLEVEVAQARRAGTALSVVVTDLDGFKQVNDDYGHLEGDRCLRQVADALTEVVRTEDRCFRWGGDEFVVLLTNAEAAEVDRVGERLACKVQQTCLKPDGRPVTLAVGHARLHEGMDADDLLAAADLALISLKAVGQTSSR